jgi:hypothetical protein
MFRSIVLFLALIAACSAFHSSVVRSNAMRSLKMEAGPGEIFVPDMPRRNTMNAILVGAVGVSALGLAVPYISFFVPASGGGGGGGTVAKGTNDHFHSESSPQAEADFEFTPLLTRSLSLFRV